MEGRNDDSFTKYQSYTVHHRRRREEVGGGLCRQYCTHVAHTIGRRRDKQEVLLYRYNGTNSYIIFIRAGCERGRRG